MKKPLREEQNSFPKGFQHFNIIEETLCITELVTYFSKSKEVNKNKDTVPLLL
jgi:hypothetical protein